MEVLYRKDVRLALERALYRACYDRCQSSQKSLPISGTMYAISAVLGSKDIKLIIEPITCGSPHRELDTI